MFSVEEVRDALMEGVEKLRDEAPGGYATARLDEFSTPVTAADFVLTLANGQKFLVSVTERRR